MYNGCRSLSRKEEPIMKLTFLGANHEVTGSRTLLEWQTGRYALIDCGMEQGENIYQNAEMPIPASQVEYVFITHAHIDHTGMLPQLYRQGFRGKVYATKETTNLSSIMLADSAHIQVMEAEYKSRKAQRAGQPPVEPDYDLEDVNGLLKLFRPCDYKQPIRVDDGLTVRFTDIGHLLGSASIELWCTEGDVTKKVVFSGDIGNYDQPILNDPQTVEEADYLIVESTYGNRLHEKRQDPLPMLTSVIQRTLDRGGNVIIPSFAVGRTQELLYFIREIKQRGLVKGHDGFPVYVDSPLANEATAVFLQCDTACLDPDARAVMAQGVNPIAFDGLECSVTADESKALNTDPTPKVIISASGMCDAGRIRHHLKYNLWRPECTILFVGYQSNGTLGRAIYEGAKSVKLFGDEIAVEAEVALLAGVSGHADRDGILNWVSRFKKIPGRIFVNHGEDEACMALVQSLKERFGAVAESPYSGSEFDLLADAWSITAQPIPYKRGKQSQPKQTGKPSASAKAYDALLAAARRLLETAQKHRDMEPREMQSITDKLNHMIEEMKN